MNVLQQQVWQFSQNFCQYYQKQHQTWPKVQHDEEWPSPCIIDENPNNEAMVAWQPVQINELLSFANVESALNFSLHQDIKDYFTTVYSESITAYCDHGGCELLFAWNKADFERLQQNLIGHILMKQKLKQPITLFFALTDEDDIIISLDNSTGEVWAEQVGLKPHKKLANSIAEFIQLLSFQ